MWDGVERRRRDHPPSPTWDGVERRRASAAEARELRERIVGRLEHRRLVRGVATHGGVFVLAVLAAFGACWLVALVLMAGAFSPELTQALKVGAMAASGSVAVIGAIVSWRVGWRSFFVGWLVGGQLYMALALTTA